MMAIWWALGTFVVVTVLMYVFIQLSGRWTPRGGKFGTFQAGDAARPVTFRVPRGRQRFIVIGDALLAFFVAANWASDTPPGPYKNPLTPAEGNRGWWTLVVCSLLAAHAIAVVRRRVVVTDQGLRVRNWFRWIDLPWAGIARFDTAAEFFFRAGLAHVIAIRWGRWRLPLLATAEWFSGDPRNAVAVQHYIEGEAATVGGSSWNPSRHQETRSCARQLVLSLGLLVLSVGLLTLAIVSSH